MAGRPSRGLERALHDLATALTSTGVQWMVIGGIAVIARGVRRFTADIDATIRGDELDAAAAIRALKKRRIAPRIPRAEAFARANLVLLLRHAPSGVEVPALPAFLMVPERADRHRAPRMRVL